MKPEKVKFMLMAVDMKRAVAFYRDVIGLEEVFVSEFWTELRHGDAIIALHGGHDSSRNPTGLSFQYEDVLAIAEKIAKSGAKIASPRSLSDVKEGDITRKAIADLLTSTK